MAHQSDFRHLPLRFVADAPPKKQKSRGMKLHPETELNRKERRQFHGKRLSQASQKVIDEWLRIKQLRQQEQLPEIPEAVSLFLRVDPQSIAVEDLRKFDIEVIGEYEDGYILGASADTNLSKLREKIKKFMEGQQHQMAGLWEIVTEMRSRLEYVLSSEILEKWPDLNDEQVYVVEIGVACLGIEQIPEHPDHRRHEYSSQKRYEKAVRDWEETRNRLYMQWDELADQRYEQLMSIVRHYGGENVSHTYDGNTARLPDSFTVRLRINGKGLKDIVHNFPFIFDVAEVDELFVDDFTTADGALGSLSPITAIPPDPSAPKVCVIDSGIQEYHPLLAHAIDHEKSRSWVGMPTDVADYVPDGGHGTRVAGAVLYSGSVPRTGEITSHCWIQNARVLDRNCVMPLNLFPPELLREIVNHFKETKIFVHSIASHVACRIGHMSAWAAAMDYLTWEHDILFVNAVGNLNRQTVRRHLEMGRPYPEYLLEKSSRIANPAQSLQAISVGSINVQELNGILTSFSKALEPSAFSRTGPGIWGSIKPEVVEYGGCFAYDSNHPPNVYMHKELCPELVCSTSDGGPPIRRTVPGTSFATSRVAGILAKIQEVFPEETTLLYRALLIQSARWPTWAEHHPDKGTVIRHLGYGIPDLQRAISNHPFRITFITRGTPRIAGKQVHIYEVKIPDEIRRPGNSHNIRLEITLSYKAEPRRTRRGKHYLSTWLNWKTNRLDQSVDDFIKETIELAHSEYLTVEENELEKRKGATIPWMIRERHDHGQVKGISRQNGTVQKDWAIVKAYELPETLCIAVIGHIGWKNNMDAQVPYSLVVSFETVDEDIEIYTRMSVENEVEIEERVSLP